jgi:hypothetical protein
MLLISVGYSLSILEWRSYSLALILVRTDLLSSSHIGSRLLTRASGRLIEFSMICYVQAFCLYSLVLEN